MTTPRLRLVLAVLVPVLVSAAGVLLAWSWAGELPDPVATHWGVEGPDAYSSRATAIALTGLGLPIALVVGGIVLAVGRGRAGLRRLGAGATAGVTTMVTGIAVGGLAGQRGLADAQAAPELDGAVLVSVVAGLLVGVATAALAPGPVPGSARATRPVPASAPRVALRDGERAVWVGWAAMSPWAYVVVGVALLPTVGLMVLGVAPLALGLVLVLVALLLVASSTFRVLVGPSGLVARSVFGWPRVVVPLEDVAVARETRVSPFGDFGGWGYRLNLHGRSGVVLRAGEALEVDKGDGTSFVVTVDGAAQAAALLNTLADRSRDHPAGTRHG